LGDPLEDPPGGLRRSPRETPTGTPQGHPRGHPGVRYEIDFKLKAPETAQVP
jgi:hypothetical protein